MLLTSNGRLSMTCIAGDWRTWLAGLSMLLATGGTAMAGSLGGPLELQDEGSFFVNGETTTSSHPGTPVVGPSVPGTITVNQMYVQYRIPRSIGGPAIVMVPGSGHTGATYGTLSDRHGGNLVTVDPKALGEHGRNLALDWVVILRFVAPECQECRLPAPLRPVQVLVEPKAAQVLHAQPKVKKKVDGESIL